MKTSNNTSPLQIILNKRPLLTVSPTDLIRMAACLMQEHHVCATGVVDDEGRFIGLLTERDIIKQAVGVHRNVDKTMIGEIMTIQPIVIPMTATIYEALTAMTHHGIRNLPVVDGEKLVGIIDIRDLYEAMQNLMQKAMDEKDLVISYYYGEDYGGCKESPRPFGAV